MQAAQAFAAPCALRTTLSPQHPRHCITQRKPRRPSYSVPRVIRRQRLHSTASPPPADSGPSEESAPTPPEEEPSASADEEPSARAEEESGVDEDTEASDLALPNLKELFAGAGRPGCEQCGGKGEISCPVCEGKGFFSLTMMDTTSSAQCRLCRGGRIVPCPTCRDVVYKSVVWWDKIPSKEEDPDEKWRDEGGDEPRISWGGNPAGPNP